MNRRILACIACTAFLGVALAQFPPVDSKFLEGPRSGRRLTGDTITFCVDPRDPAHEVDRAIAQAMADALLLKADFHVIERELVTEDIQNVYIDLVNDCEVYLGFRLIAGTFPNWLTPTRAYYRTSYVVVVADPDWKDITDVPRSLALGSVAGSVGDVRLLTYINALPPEQRWARYPQASHEVAMQGVLDGNLGGALVWAPAKWQLTKSDPELADLHAVTAEGVSEPIGVGGVILVGNDFLLSQLDAAIANITEVGTVAEILGENDFPGQPAPSR